MKTKGHDKECVPSHILGACLLQILEARFFVGVEKNWVWNQIYCLDKKNKVKKSVFKRGKTVFRESLRKYFSWHLQKQCYFTSGLIIHLSPTEANEKRWQEKCILNISFFKIILLQKWFYFNLSKQKQFF